MLRLIELLLAFCFVLCIVSVVTCIAMVLFWLLGVNPNAPIFGG